ncbi:peptide ABC transporter substrate-binding protein [Enterococcus faecalis]
MKLQKILVIGCLVVVGSLISGCQKPVKTANAKQDKQIFTFIERQELPTADISLATDEVSFITLNNIYEGIYRLDQNNVLQPAGAVEAATISADGRVYKVKLRKESKWSDGVPVKAKDYVYGWQRTVDPKTSSNQAYMFRPVKHAQAIMNGKMDKSTLGIRALNDFELEITLEKATPYFNYLLALPAYFPQRQDIVDKYKTNYAKTDQRAVYNGPFVLSDFDGPGIDTNWNLKKNPTYWDHKTVKLKKIKIDVVKDANTALNLFEKGQADDTYLSGDLAQELKNDPNFIIQQFASVFYLELNQKSPNSPYKNENLRKAISFAIDRKTLVDKIEMNGSTVAKGLVTADLAFDPETHQDFVEETDNGLFYDPKQAQNYWQQAQTELGIKTLKINLLVDDTDNSKKMAEFLQAELADTLKGLEVEITPVPFAVRLDRSNKGDFQIAAAGWSADYADPSSILSLFTSNNPYNRGGFSDQDYDTAVKNAETIHTNNPNVRWHDLLTAERIFIDKMGAIPLYQQGEARLRSEKVKNILFHSTGAKYDFKWTYIA